MDWLGIGVLVIGVALLILVFILIKPLNKLAGVFESLQKTTDALPKTLTDITGQTTEIMKTSNQTIANVNNQVNEFQPLFEIVGDVGQASRNLTSVAVAKTMLLKEDTSAASEFTKEKQYQGLYGLASMLFYFSQKRKEMKNAIPKQK